MDAAKQKALEILQQSMNKKYGNGTISFLSGNEVSSVPRFSTGIPSVDWAIGGGYPKGRMVEIFGPESSGKTTLTLTAIAEAQKAGGICAFIDAEHALDLGYAQALGVNIDELIINQPDTAEEALDIAEELCNSGLVQLIVIDSVAALVPKAELDGDMGAQLPGLMARLMSQALRKLTGACAKNNVTILWLNQIRYKIGVMFGCLHYNARVTLADGSTEKIGKIVNNKMKVEVLSADKNGNIAPRKVIAWHNNGKAEQFWLVEIGYPHVSGKSTIPVGDDHVFITPTGERKLSEMEAGDQIFVKSTKYLSNEQYQIALGSVLGDGSLKIPTSGLTAALREKHGLFQNDYCKYKFEQFGNEFCGSSGYDKIGQFWWDSKPTAELVHLGQYKSDGAIRYIDKELASEIELRALAIWYLDDGTFSGTIAKWGQGKSTIYATKLDNDSKDILNNRLVELGLPRASNTKKGISFSGKDNLIFQTAIAPFVPKCMKYKIHPKLHDLVGSKSEVTKRSAELALIPARIKSISKYHDTPSPFKYDITVEGNHSYFVDNVLVHNSPETTSGGNALKFYASIRMDIRRRGQIKDGETVIANDTELKVIKNKTAPPYRIAEFEIEFGKGVNKTLDLVRMAVKQHIVEKSGAWYSYKGERLGQGEKNTATFLEENPAVVTRIVEQLQQLKLEDTNGISTRNNDVSGAS